MFKSILNVASANPQIVLFLVLSIGYEINAVFLVIYFIMITLSAAKTQAAVSVHNNSIDKEILELEA